MSLKMTGAMVLADFRLDDLRLHSKALIRARVESLATYAANYHNSYETLSLVLSERTKALRAVEAQVSALLAEQDGQDIPTTEHPTR